MNITKTILIKAFIKPYYRQYAGLFFFLFIILFGVVGYANGAGLFAYHFSLIRGILKNPYIFLLILFIWLLYIRKTNRFVIDTIRKPEFKFLQMLSLIEVRRIYWLLVWVAFMLLLPIVFYAILIIAEGIYLQTFLPCLYILLFFLCICMLSGRGYLDILQNPGKTGNALHEIISFKKITRPYWSFFISYIAAENKLLFSGIKLFSCCMLYAMALTLNRIDYDLSMIFLFFSFGILGHGLLIHKLRAFEENRLTFYRNFPVSLPRRFLQYSILYFILLIPEMLLIVLLTPNYLHLKDAFIFIFFSYSMLLFLNSLLLIQFFRIKEYLKVILCIFLLIFLSVLTNTIPWLCLLLFLSSGSLFFKRYYLYEG